MIQPGPRGAPGSIIEFADVSVVRHREHLLSGVSFQVKRGTIHALVGPNGAGKTTLLSALLGLIPFTGKISVDWQAGGRIGYAPQAFVVDPSLPITVEDFLGLTRQRLPVCFGVRSATRARLSKLLLEVGLGGLERRQLSVLSGGELRRVLVANALDPLPELLILDEPASGLDEGGVQQLETLLRTLSAGGATVLLVSHDLDQVRRIADWVTVLDRSVVSEGAPGATLAHERVSELLPSSREHRQRHAGP